MRRILVLRLDHLGDVITTLPLVEHLRAAYPDASLTLATSAAGALLLRDTPAVSSILVWNAPWFARNGSSTENSSIRDFISQLKSKFDLAIDPRGDARHIAILTLAGLPFRAGIANTGGGSWLHRETTWDPQLHVVDQQLEIVKALRLPVDPDKRNPRLGWTPREEECAWLRATISFSEFIAIHPDAGTSAKKWGASSWRQLLQSDLLAHQPLVLCGQNRALGEEIQAKHPGPILNLMGQTSMEQLITLLQKARLVISTDSGPAQIATALQRPTFILWSGTNRPEVWAPLGKHCTWVHHAVPCEPCGHETCPLPQHPCMTDLTPHTVQKALLTFLQIHPHASAAKHS